LIATATTATFPFAPTADAAARLRVAATYAWRHHRPMDFKRPSRFTELVQIRKLHDRTERHPRLMDKLAAKHVVATRLGEDWTVPTLWQGTHLPASPPFACPAILKARHGCNQYRVLLTEPDEARWRGLKSATRRWLKRPYGQWLDEWAYRDVPRGLLAEPLLGGGLPLPIDYKVYVFGGTATHVQVHLGRGQRHRWILHDRDWMPLASAADAPRPPSSLAAMLDAAEALAKGESFLRVDFYDVGGWPYFGEFCLYPGSGLDPFAADWIDLELGALWLEALAANRARPALSSAGHPASLVPDGMATVRTRPA